MRKILTVVLMLTIGTSMVEAQECDLNKDGFVNSSDVVYLYNYIRNGGSGEVKDETFTVNGVSFKMIGVEGGTFIMGSHADKYVNPHDVTLSNFSMGEAVVTQALWKAVMNQTPTSDGPQWEEFDGLGDNYPAYSVSYEDAQAFITKLNSLTGRTFRLPTEAEWEYAALGGKYAKNCYYSGSDVLELVGWYRNNSKTDAEDHIKMQPVKRLNHNELGIYDMSGNVLEWCHDWYDDYSTDAQVNPSGPTHGVFRVVRGGCFSDVSEECRPSYRDYTGPADRLDFVGFRLAM